jgi:hypothetical protein
MRIEAVVCSVGFGDFLWDTLPRNVPLVDDLVVVTSAEDKESASAAVRHGARVLTTDAHKRTGRTFDKAAAINYAFQYLRRKDWLLVMDADIVMPPLARRLIENAQPDVHCLYGVDRWDVPGWVSYAGWLTDTSSNPGTAFFLNAPPSWRVGGRISAAGQDGWRPCGFWQLWHSSQWGSYPELPDADAEAVDLVHAGRWPRRRRVLLPDWYALHLVSAKVPMGTDWHGRRSQRWGPPQMTTRPAASASVSSGPARNGQAEAEERPAAPGPAAPARPEGG